MTTSGNLVRATGERYVLGEGPTWDLVGDDRARYPAAGTLFTTRPGVQGLPPALCAAGTGL